MAADEQSTDLIPLLGDDDPHFDIAMRGYDRRQVEEYLARIDADLADAHAARDAALATSADRAAQLANREAHIESLKRQAVKATESINPANVSDRIRDMLQLATDEAAQTRRAAEEEAERVLSAAKSDAERVRTEAAAEQQRLTASAAQRSAEADQKLAQARVQAAAELDIARAEINRMTAQATAELETARAEFDRMTEQAAEERARLDEQVKSDLAEADRLAQQRRITADEDFEITLRSRRTAAERTARAEREAAEATARGLVEAARDEVTRIKAEQTATEQALKDLYDKLGGVLASIDRPQP
jgi:DivIVA domain-containing protein